MLAAAKSVLVEVRYTKPQLDIQKTPSIQGFYSDVRKRGELTPLLIMPGTKNSFLQDLPKMAKTPAGLLGTGDSNVNSIRKKQRIHTNKMFLCYHLREKTVARHLQKNQIEHQGKSARFYCRNVNM